MIQTCRQISSIIFRFGLWKSFKLVIAPKNHSSVSNGYWIIWILIFHFSFQIGFEWTKEIFVMCQSPLEWSKIEQNTTNWNFFQFLSWLKCLNRRRLRPFFNFVQTLRSSNSPVCIGRRRKFRRKSVSFIVIQFLNSLHHFELH